MAWAYDLLDAPMEYLGGQRRRARLISSAAGSVLEVGIGTGKNLSHYRSDVQVIGVDTSPKMLARARKRMRSLDVDAVLLEADAHTLPFGDSEFDTAVETSILCSVADPETVLAELIRVTRPGGRILLLEHVRPHNPILGLMADAASLVTRRLFGFYANRRTEGVVMAANVKVVEVRRNGVWRAFELASLPPSAD